MNVKQIECRIKEEYKKYKNSDSIDWTEMAAHKIVSEIEKENRQKSIFYNPKAEALKEAIEEHINKNVLPEMGAKDGIFRFEEKE